MASSPVASSRRAWYASGPPQSSGGYAPAAHVTRIRRILYMLRSARQPSDMDQPGFRLHPLRGEYQGHWSAAVSGNWRIVFRFEAGGAMDVDLVDYH